MNITFTGIQNVAGIFEGKDKYKQFGKKLVVQLTDEGTRDLTENEVVFKKFRDPLNLGFLRIESIKDNDGKDVFLINHQKLEVNDENLGIFNKIAKLLAKITKEKNGFMVKKDYIDSPNSSVNILNMYILPNCRPPKKNEIIELAHDTEIARFKAYEINAAIQNKMAKYFDYDYKDVKLPEFEYA